MSGEIDMRSAKIRSPIPMICTTSQPQSQGVRLVKEVIPLFNGSAARTAGVFAAEPALHRVLISCYRNGSPPDSSLRCGNL